MKIIIITALLFFTHTVMAIGVPFQVARNAYATTNVLTTAYVTVASALTASSLHVNLSDSSGQALYLSWAATCGALASTANTFIISATSHSDFDLRIPLGYCVGLKAITASATTGEFDITFFK